MRSNFHSKYVSEDNASAAPQATREHGIPIGARCTLQSVDEAQYVEFSTYTSHVAKADPNAEVTALAAAEIARICLTTMDPTLKISVVRAVERAPIEGPSNKNNAKLHGYFVLQFDSHRDETAAYRGYLLRDTIQQFVVQQFHTLLSDDSDMPRYARALRFKLAPVNTDETMPLGLVGGLLPDDLDDFDVRAQELLLHTMIEEADICMVGPDGEPTHALFSSKASIRKNLGILFYTTSTVTTNGRNGRAIAVGYAKTEEGEEAARIFADACEGKSLSVFGGINVTFTRFPSRGQRGKKTKEDPVRTFVRDHVNKNLANCAKHYSTHTIENVTALMYDETIVNHITSNCNHVLGLIPRVMRGTPADGEVFRMKITVVVHRIGATCLKDGSYYRRIFMTDLPQLFPPAATEDFKKVAGKKAAPTNDAPHKSGKSVNSNWEQNLDKNFTAVKTSSGPYVVGWGRGGRGSAGIKDSWFGPGGAQECTKRVSGAVFKKVNSRAEGMALLEKWYGIKDEAELLEFHKNVPHNETNLWPTWSLQFQGMPHRYNAKEYTFVEHDDDAVLAARLNATIFYTGSTDGVITQRNQLTKSKPSDFYDVDPETEEDDSDDGGGKPSADIGGDFDDDPAANSQSFFGENDSGGKRRRCRTPSPKNNPFTNSNWMVIVNPSCITTRHDLNLHSQSFSGCDKLTAYEPVVCTVPWDLTNRCTMAVFAVDEMTAHSYAHWVEHQARLIFNVPVQTQVRSPALKSTARQMEVNEHAESMATSDLTYYVKSELPLKHHLEFSRYIQWCNHPTALITKLLADWKTIDRIKDANTAKASPKGAEEFDATMMDVTEEVVESSFDGPTPAAVAAATAATMFSDNGTSNTTTQFPAASDDKSIDSIDLLMESDTEPLP